jgi:hypothetical protein
MSKAHPQRPGRKPKPPLKPRQIQGAKYLAPLLELLAPLHAHRAGPNRQLHYDQYCAWLLLYFFTPILTSMRGLQQASGFEQLHRKLGLGRFSLGSFSEAGNVFDPALLEPIMEQLGERVDDLAPDSPLSGLGRRPTAVDGSLLHALPKMVWALWLDENNHAAKLHLQFDLLSGVPARASLSAGQASETRALERQLQADRLYVADRGYFDYALMAAILTAGSSFLTRVYDSIAYEVLGETPIDAAAAAAGIELDAIVRVGSTKNNRDKIDQPLRLVRIAVPEGATSTRRRNKVDSKTKAYRSRESGHTLVLLTDQLELPADQIALLYRQRWQIELFFRWFKKVLQADRPLALSQNGMTIAVYCALIASLLVTLWTGRKPTKRTFELLCFYFAGWVGERELLTHLQRLAEADAPKPA